MEAKFMLQILLAEGHSIQADRELVRLAEVYKRTREVVDAMGPAME
jgi:hypothetical protein